MDQPNVLLLKAAARLNAYGDSALALDLIQLSRKWTPESEQALIDDFSLTDQEPLHDT